ncbi:MAG: hypothetical protein ABIA76_00850 [Candidatus Diapherotrites archaeon]
MKGLIPILTKKESSREFLSKVFPQCRELVVLAVIDASEKKTDFGLTASDIAQANEIISQILVSAKENKAKAEDILEWGELHHKLVNTVKLSNVKKVFLIKTDSEEQKGLIKELKKEGIELQLIELIELQEEKEEEKKENSKGFFGFLPKLN